MSHSARNSMWTARARRLNQQQRTSKRPSNCSRMRRFGRGRAPASHAGVRNQIRSGPWVDSGCSPGEKSAASWSSTDFGRSDSGAVISPCSGRPTSARRRCPSPTIRTEYRDATVDYPAEPHHAQRLRRVKPQILAIHSLRAGRVVSLPR